MNPRIRATLLLLATIVACGPSATRSSHDFVQLSEAATVCSGGVLTSGIDVAEFQGSIDWNAVVGDTTNNVRWAYAKATEGGGTIGGEYDDAEFLNNWPAMKSAGILRGAYHFFHCTDDGATQADNYLNRVNTAGGFASGDLPPMLDWEGTSDSCQYTQAAVTNAQAFIDEIMAKTGSKTVIYTGPGYFNGISVSTSQFASVSLWNAAYSCSLSSVCSDNSTCPPANCQGVPPSACPSIPSTWSNWKMWQWNDSLAVAGITTQNPDADVFNGSLSDLQTWAGGMVTASCPNGDGTYCGGDGYSGTTGTLYNCAGGTFTVNQVCANGCTATAPGGSDACATGTTSTFAPPAQATGNAAITLVNWPDKHMDLFAKSPSGTEMHTSTTTTGDSWSSPATLASGAACGSAAAFWGAPWSYPDLFSPMESGAMDSLSYTSANGWSNYMNFGGSAFTNATTAMDNTGMPHVFALGGDGAIWWKAWDTTTSAWGGWTSLGTPTGSTFATGAGTITWGNGTVEIFATDTTGTVWHMWSTVPVSATGWSVWTLLGTGIASQPVGVRWVDGQAGHGEVFATGTDGQLYHSNFSYTNDWPTFTVVNAGSQIIGQPSAIMVPGANNTSAGTAEVFVRDSIGRVIHTTGDGTTYSAFTYVGDQIAGSDPFGWTRADGNGEVFAIDQSGNLTHSYNSGSGWGAWSAIGSGFDQCAPSIAQNTDAGMPMMDAGPPPPVDAGPPDAGPPPPVDAGPPDAGHDAGTPDAGHDAGTPDAGHDAGPPPPVDAGPPDAGTQVVDAGPPDAGTVPLFDAGPTDAGSQVIDAGSSLDAGSPVVDAGSPDEGVDSGTQPETDGGTFSLPQSDGGAPTASGGCGCSPGGSPDGLLWLGLAFGKLGLRRRKRPTI